MNNEQRTMRKGLLRALFGLVAIIALGFGFFGCGDNEDNSSPKHTHQWGEWTVTTPATCIAAGEETRICSVDARHIEKKAIAVDPVNGHDWEWVITTDPNYFTEGVETGTCKHDPSHTTTRPVQTNQYITSVADLTEYLATKTGTVESPVLLPMKIDLGTMTEADSGWRLLLTALETAGEYVDLDLSACTMNGTEFNPVRTVETGKEKIVSIALPDTATNIASGTSYASRPFRYFTNLTSFSGTGLTSIGGYAFYDCTNLALTELPAGLTSIGDNTFDSCTSLALTKLPVGLTSIGDSAFYGCTSLALTELPVGLTTISDYTFGECTSLALVELPAGLTTIGCYAFYGCSSLALAELPAGHTAIGGGAFYGHTNLALTELPAGLTEIGNRAFYECTNLALTELPAGLISIGDYAFQDCTNLALTELPVGLTEIANRAFFRCTNLALTELPAGITSVSNDAFWGCRNLAQISLPAGLTSIGDTAFDNCTNLTLVTCLAETPPGMGRTVFNVTHSTMQIKVPAGSVDAYKAADGWSTYADKIFAIK
jgi:hypothetical protein